MAKLRKSSANNSEKKNRPVLSPELRESELISLATDLVEQRLRDGTATSQETVHFLKLGSSTAKLEREMMKKDMELKHAKIKTLASAQEIKELYSEALNAIRKYSGQDVSDDD